MDYGIGMFLAGLVSGASIAWYSGILQMRIKHTDPKKSKRESMLYRHLLEKAGQPGQRLIRNMAPLRRGFFIDICRVDSRRAVPDNARNAPPQEGVLGCALPPLSAAIFLPALSNPENWPIAESPQRMDATFCVLLRILD